MCIPGLQVSIVKSNEIKFIYTPHISQIDSGVFTIKTVLMLK